MAEVLHGVPVDSKKLAAYNRAPVKLMSEILEAHADKPDLPKKDKVIAKEQDNILDFRTKRELVRK